MERLRSALVVLVVLMASCASAQTPAEESAEAGRAQVTPTAVGSPAQEVPAESVSTPSPTADDPAPSPTIAAPPGPVPESGELLMEPVGPYDAGDEVTLYLSPDDEIDIYYGGPMFCARVEGFEEFCGLGDGFVGARSERSMGVPSAIVAIPQLHFGPAGQSDCNDADVTCRLMYRTSTGDFVAGAPLEYRRSTELPRAEIAITAADEPGLFTIETVLTEPPDGSFLEDSEFSWLREVVEDSLPGQGFDPSRLRFELTLGAVCGFGFGGRPIGSAPLIEVPDWWGGLAARPGTLPDGSTPALGQNCDWDGIPSEQRFIDDQQSVRTLRLPRMIYGYNGWMDCARDTCFLSVDLRWMYEMGDGSTLGSDLSLAYALIEPPPDWPENELPAISIRTPPPYRHGDTVTIEATDPRREGAPAISFCVGKANCLYRFSTNDDGVATVEWTLPSSGCVPVRCYFGIDSGGEGLPPPVVAPVHIDE